MSVTDIERSLATQAISDGPVAQLQKIKTALNQTITILGADTYQADIGIFFNAMFEPYLTEVGDIQGVNQSFRKCVKSIFLHFNTTPMFHINFNSHFGIIGSSISSEI